MNLLDKLERKTKFKGIANLMTYIIAVTGVVYGLNLLIPSLDIYNMLALYPGKILQGEVWRLFTFIFIPPSSSLIFILFVLYLYYMIGSALEQEWGSFKFTVYYIIGMIGIIAASFITGEVATSNYLNLSLFLAFATVYPDFELLLFFFIPVKMKYLGWLSFIGIGYSIIFRPLPEKIVAIVSIINYFLFFFKDILHSTSNNTRALHNKNKFKSAMTMPKTFHRCTVCGITEKDDPNMEFRYCSKCEGHHEYCMNHLKDHTHITGE